jgi:hypothetical protein
MFFFRLFPQIHGTIPMNATGTKGFWHQKGICFFCWSFSCKTTSVSSDNSIAFQNAISSGGDFCGQKSSRCGQQQIHSRAC